MNRKDICDGLAVLFGMAKPFPKGICEPARRKILDQAKFPSKGRFMGHWVKTTRSYSLKTKFYNAVCKILFLLQLPQVGVKL